MKMPITRMLFAALISFNLCACSSMAGNVVPPSGPAMEKVYGSMSDQDSANDSDKSAQSNNLKSKQNLKIFRQNNIDIQNNFPVSNISHDFHKIPNPELRMYVYPHLGGRDQIPVPGYTTEFNVYERNYYMA